MQGAGEVLDLFGGQLRLCVERLEVGVDAGQLIEQGGGRQHLIDRADLVGQVFVAGQCGHGFGGEPGELLAVAEPVALGHQRVVFTGHERGRVDLLDLVGEAFGAAFHLRLVLLQAIDLAAGRGELVDQRRDGGTRVHQLGVAVKQANVRGGFEQAEVGALAVDIHQLVADFGQEFEIDGDAIDAGGRPAVGAHFTADDQFVQRAAVGQFFTLENWGEREGRAPVNHEHAFNEGAFRPGADHRRVHAAAKQQFHGVNQDRLARAGFAGDHVEAGRERQIEPVNDGKVLDADFLQHAPDFLDVLRNDELLL